MRERERESVCVLDGWMDGKKERKKERKKGGFLGAFCALWDVGCMDGKGTRAFGRADG